MFKPWWIVVGLSTAPGLSAAAECPDFFRFVDFGMVEGNGTVRRGGTILRAEGFDGASLIAPGASTCREVRDIGRDGHGNPIPVVARLVYDPATTGLDVAELAVTDLGDSLRAAEDAAFNHRARLGRTGVAITRGNRALCAGEADAISCQVVSPYPGPAPLVVYCDGGACRMPVLAIDGRLGISAAWVGAGETAGEDIDAMVQAIHRFLAPLTSLARH